MYISALRSRSDVNPLVRRAGFQVVQGDGMSGVRVVFPSSAEGKGVVVQQDRTAGDAVVGPVVD